MVVTLVELGPSAALPLGPCRLPVPLLTGSVLEPGTPSDGTTFDGLAPVGLALGTLVVIVVEPGASAALPLGPRQLSVALRIASVAEPRMPLDGRPFDDPAAGSTAAPVSNPSINFVLSLSLRFSDALSRFHPAIEPAKIITRSSKYSTVDIPRWSARSSRAPARGLSAFIFVPLTR
jgi:hypothetical protein